MSRFTAFVKLSNRHAAALPHGSAARNCYNPPGAKHMTRPIVSYPFDPRNPPEYIYRVPAYYRKHRPVPRVRIGATYSPPVRVTPAISGPYDAGEMRGFWSQVAWGLALGVGFLSFVGVTHLLFGV